MGLQLIKPDWDVPASVTAVVTTREGKNPESAYGSFNLAQHVGDDPQVVQSNRERLKSELKLKRDPVWLNQVHGTRVLVAGGDENTRADAAMTSDVGLPLCVLVADCVPILLCNRNGTSIGVAHAGWRGLADGVIGSIVAAMNASGELTAWIGPAIGPCHFEVGADVKQQFPDSESSFQAGKRDNHWMMDLRREARRQLVQSGVDRVTAIDLCTSCNNEDLYSYRREGVTGRFAALIWISTGSR